MYALYSALLALALVVGAPWFLYQALRRQKYLGSLGQRFGALPVVVQPRRRAVDLDSRGLGRRSAGGPRRWPTS